MKQTLDRLFQELLHPKALIAIWVVAIGLRLIYALAVTPPPTADFLDYHELATRMADGQGYVWKDGNPTAYRAIGYPAYLGAVYAVFGASIKAGQLANTALCILALWLAFLLARKVLNNELAARLALILLAIHPNGIAYAALLASEPLSLVCLLGGILCWWESFRTKKVRWHYIFLTGILFAAATFVKPQLLLVPGFLFLMPRSWQPFTKRPFLQTIVIYLVMAACIAPWTYRNFTQIKSPALISSNGGANLYVGNSRFASGRFYWGPDVEEYLAVHAPEDKMPVPAWSKKLGELAIQDMKEFPVKTALRIPLKVFFLYAADIDGIRWTLLSYENPSLGKRLFYYTVMGLGQLWYLVIWLPLLWVFVKKEWRKIPVQWLILLIPALTLTSVSLLFFGASRFHFPFLPFLVLLSAGISVQFFRN